MSQAVAFGGGGLAATVCSDVARHIMTTGATAYAVVFLCQALVFVYAATLAAGLDRAATRQPRSDADFAVQATDRR